MKKIITTIYLVFALCLMAGVVFFKSDFWEKYFFTPCGITKDVNGLNSVSVKDSKVIVPVSLGGVMYYIPAPYVGRVGAWDSTDHKYYGSLTLHVKGTDFSPNKDEIAISPNKPLDFLIASKRDEYRDIPNKLKEVPRRLPQTIAEAEEAIKHNPSYYFGYGYEKLTRAPSLDKFGLIAFQTGSDEVYVGKSSSGSMHSFTCIKKMSWVTTPLCIVSSASNLDDDIDISYTFAKQYIADWDRIDAGVSRLFGSFRHN